MERALNPEFSRQRPYRPRDPATVSLYMSRVRSTGTTIERTLGRAMWDAGLRYRKHYKITGKPDFAFVRARIAVFCDSHFWHGYGWGRQEKTLFRRRRDFWTRKIESNISRDRQVDEQLRQSGWKVIRFWEHEIIDEPEECVRRIRRLMATER